MSSIESSAATRLRSAAAIYAAGAIRAARPLQSHVPTDNGGSGHHECEVERERQPADPSRAFDRATPTRPAVADPSIGDIA